VLKLLDENDRAKAGQLDDDPFADGEPVEPPGGPDEDVWLQLELGKGDVPRPTLHNAHTVFSRDPRWAGKIRFNAFAQSIEFHGTPVAKGRIERERDALDSKAALWLADNYGRMAVPTPKVAEAIQTIGDDASYHPVQDYLRDLEWDHTSRLDTVLTRYFGVPDAPLTRALGACFLRSCVARVLPLPGRVDTGPGCKVDTTLILVGAQGLYKSSALRALAVRPQWFADTRLDLSSKDLFEQIAGKWIYEIAELDAFKGREWSRIKGVLSSPNDTYRRPYGKHAVSALRQVVFAGTTNEDEFLGDPTGARRFWPVRCTTIDLAALRRDVDQLWAEAVVTYRAGAPWWLDAERAAEAEHAAAEFRMRDAWDEVVEGWLYGRTGTVSTTQVLMESPLKKLPGECTNHDIQRVATVLKACGWTRTRSRVAGSRGVRWAPPCTSSQA
jgi:putative DNA primase/helicase